MGYALVTGASSGIGLEYARALAAKGYDIIVVSNMLDGNQRVAEELQSRYGVQAVAIYADLAQRGAAEELYKEVCRQGIEVDCLINNAGMLLFSQLEHTAVEAIDKIVTLHCTTPATLCRLFAADMRQRGRGHILLMSSITAWTPYPTISHYAATKAFLRSFGESLWYELQGSGVSITTVFPSAVDTQFYDLSPSARRWLLRCGVMMSAEQVARRALRAMFASRRRCLPGLLTKIEAAICAILPSAALLPIMKIPAIRRILERV